jgi:hypothetical protein
VGKYVYIDESGDECLDLLQSSISSFYVVCALVVDPANHEAAIHRFTEVRDRYFKNREMKSSGVTNNNQRQRVLQDLLGIPFSLHVLVGNKSLLTSSGLRYPKSFIKFLQGSLYKEIVKDYSTVCIRSDKIKNPSFMREMRAYLERHFLYGGLFESHTFDFVDSNSDVCIQAADFIGGSIRLCFERNPQTAMTDPLMEMLRWHITQFIPFPKSYGRYIAKNPGASEHDPEIEARAVLEAEEFLRKHDHGENNDRDLQVAAVRMLLSTLNWRDDCWVATAALMERLSVIAPEPLSEQSFRSIIGKLRDEGVLIASRTAGGYKLPTSMAEITEFVNRQNSQLAPMIDRVRTARDTVLRATDNCVDILAAPEYQNLRAAVLASPHWSEGVREPLDPKPAKHPSFTSPLTIPMTVPKPHAFPVALTSA